MNVKKAIGQFGYCLKKAILVVLLLFLLKITEEMRISVKIM